MLPPDSFRDDVQVLAFDLYDTLLDRESVLVPALETLLAAGGLDDDPAVFLRRYLAMHFRDSLIDALVPGPHTPFAELTRRALRYRLEQAGVAPDDVDVGAVVDAWRDLGPYRDVDAALARLADEYALVGLSNGDPDMLAAVEPSFETPLADVISVAEAGAYKPHPAPYRLLCERHDVEPAEVLFVSAHTFDLVGAAAVGMRGAYVNRHANPFGGWPQQPDLVVDSTGELADALLG